MFAISKIGGKYFDQEANFEKWINCFLLTYDSYFRKKILFYDSLLSIKNINFKVKRASVNRYIRHKWVKGGTSRYAKKYP